jgi:hypothetical protein
MKRPWNRHEPPPDTEFEAALREGLQRDIVPPPMPYYMRDRLDQIGERAMSGADSRKISIPRIGTPRLAGAVAGLAVVAIVAGAVVWPRLQADSAASPSGATGGSGLVTYGLTPDGGGFYYIDGEGLRVTDDYGATWESRNVPSVAASSDRLGDVMTLDFVDAQHGWMTTVTDTGDGWTVLIHRTADAGASWQSTQVAQMLYPIQGSSPSGGRVVYAAPHFWDDQHGRVEVTGVAEGSLDVTSCQAFDTSDGGATWSEFKPGTCPDRVSLAWTTNLLGIQIGPLLGGLMTAQVTRDGGQTWQNGTLGSRTTIGLWDLVSDEAGTLTLVIRGPVASQSEEVLQSTDGGLSWTHAYDMTVPSSLLNLYRISVVGANRWRATFELIPTEAECPSQNCPTHMELMESVDAGRTWSVVNSSIPGPTSFWNSTNGIALGGVKGEVTTCVYVTSDGGANWHKVN